MEKRKVSIPIHEETKKKLKQMKIFHRETFDDIVNRLIEYKEGEVEKL